MEDDVDSDAPEPKPKAADWSAILAYEKLMAMAGTSIAKGKGKGQQEAASKKEEVAAQ